MRLPQFKLAGIFWATLWLSICFAGWALPSHLNMSGLMPTLFVLALRWITIPAAIGALFGRTLYGLIAGVVLYVALYLFGVYLLASGAVP